jgi:uroporphyrinogen-III synthase
VKVLLTRARDDAEASAARLAARGIAAVAAPVIEIVATPVCDLPDADFTLATSRRAFAALAALPPAERARLESRPLFVVGDATAAAARFVGFRDIRVADGDAGALLARLAMERPAPGESALYLAGADRKPALEQGLAAAGIAVVAIVAYEARPRAWTPAEIEAAREVARDNAPVLHYSRRSAALFLERIDACGLAVGAFRHFALSQDAGAPIQNRGSRVIVPRRAREETMFDLLVEPPAR